jgi:hypothetical protein
MTNSHRPASMPSGLKFGRSPHNPWRTVTGAKALAPSCVWFPGRRGFQTGCGAHPYFTPPIKETR